MIPLIEELSTLERNCICCRDVMFVVSGDLIEELNRYVSKEIRL